MMMDKAQKKQSFRDTKVFSVSVFSADISKNEEIPRWQPIDKVLHCDFPANIKSYNKFTIVLTISRAILENIQLPSFCIGPCYTWANTAIS